MGHFRGCGRLAARAASLAVGVCLASLVGAPAAAAGPTWLDPFTFGTGDATPGAAEAPLLLTGSVDGYRSLPPGFGDTALVFFRGGDDPAAGPARALYRTRSRSGELSAQEHVAPGVDQTPLAVAAGPALLWKDNPGERLMLTDETVREERVSVQINSPATRFDDATVVTGHDTIVGWRNETTGRAQVRAYSDFFGLYPTVDVSPPGIDALDPVVAGNALVAWRTPAGEIQLREVVKPRTGELGPVETIAAAGDQAEDLRIAVNDQHRVVLVWRSGATGRVMIRERALSGPSPPAQPLSAVGVEADAPQVGLDHDGNATVVWRETDAGVIVKRRRLADGALTAAADVSEREAGADVGPPVLALMRHQGLPSSGAVAAWHDVSEGQIEARAFDLDGPAGDVVDLATSAGVSQPAIAGDPTERNALVAWRDEENDRIDAAAFDGNAPIPVQPWPYIDVYESTCPCSYPLAVYDAWSAVGPTRWDFDDGSPPAQGAKVTHAFRYGVFDPWVTTEDAVGNKRMYLGMVRPGDDGRIWSLPYLVQLRKARLTRKRFRVAKRSTPVSARLARGTTIVYEAFGGRLRTGISVQGRAAGRKAGRRCVTPTRQNRRRRPCVRWTRVGKLYRSHIGGTQRVRFTGRIRDRKLRPGRYRFGLRSVLRADPTIVSKLVRLHFRVLGG